MLLYIEGQMRGIDVDKNFAVDEYQALCLLKKAQNKVTEKKNIRNCFHHAKFVDQQDETPAPETSPNEVTEALFRQLSDLTPLDITHDKYIDIDSCVHTTA